MGAAALEAAARAVAKIDGASVEETRTTGVPDEEETRVFGAADRRTMFGLAPAHPLAGVEAERPVSSATRTAEAFRHRDRITPTKISPILREVPADPHPICPAVPLPAVRFEALRRESEARGLPVEHCHGRDCNGGRPCACMCEPCDRIRALLDRACAPREDEHCGGAACFQSAEDRGTLDACMCSCDPCDAAWRALMAEQEGRDTASVPPPPSTLDARVARRWIALVAEAQAAGKLADHCYGPACIKPGEPMGPCACLCDGCGTLRLLLAQAIRETGPC